MNQTLPSVCPLDCPDACSMAVTVQDNQIVQVRGSRVNPLTRSALCAKVAHYPEHVHGPDRLRTPLRRKGAKGEGHFESITWDVALDLVYERFTAVCQDYGPQAILPLNYAGPHGLLAQGSMDLRFFHKLGATRLARRPLCAGVKGEAFVGTYGAVPLMRPEHVAHARLIVVWGNNITVSLGEALPNTEIFRRLAKRFGFTEPHFQANDAELMDEALSIEDPRLQGRRPSQIAPDKALSMKFNGEEAILFKTTFPQTPSGKIELQSSYLAQAYGRSLPTYQPVVSPYPLSLITPSSDQRTTSTFGNLRYSDEVWVDMNPQDAASRNLCDGLTVRVWNDQGEVHLPVRITETVRPGVVSSEKGAWFRTSDNGQTVSALAPSHYADLSDGACYNDARVEVAALEDSE